VSERRVCRVLGQPRSTQRYRPRPPDDEDRLTERIVELASRYGRYGYQRISWLLQAEGWRVNHKRVERIWRQEGLKVPRKQPKRGRLWLADGSCVRRRPEYRHHVWSYDFVSDRTADSRPLKMLTLIDEYSRQCLAIRVQRRMQSIEVLETLAECFIAHGRPTCIRSDNGAELKSKLLVDWLTSLGVQPLFIEPGSPWENGYIESFNARPETSYSTARCSTR
jgi:transposase InsO family protein